LERRKRKRLREEGMRKTKTEALENSILPLERLDKEKKENSSRTEIGCGVLRQFSGGGKELGKRIW